jgi:hypothetical protein
VCSSDLIEGLEEARAVEGVHDIFMTLTVGDEIQPLRSNIGKAGHIIAYGNSRREAEEAAQTAKECIIIQTEPIETCV